jgi:hypothetical protein
MEHAGRVFYLWVNAQLHFFAADGGSTDELKLPNKGTIPEIAWVTPVRIASVPVEIRTHHLQNDS